MKTGRMRGKTTLDPPFWIRDADDSGRPIDPAVLDSARRIWKRVVYLAESKLRDPARAAEVLEAAAVAVSRALRRSRSEPIADHDAFLYLACLRRMNRLASKARREQSGLELLAATAADGWVDGFFTELRVKELLPYMDERTRRLLAYQSQGYSWRETAEQLGYASRHSAEVQFSKGLQAARKRLIRRVFPEPEGSK
jgi:hypothetical protein